MTLTGVEVSMPSRAILRSQSPYLFHFRALAMACASAARFKSRIPQTYRASERSRS